MKIAICPGSFDPVTHGHLDIIRRAACLFDKVIVLVMTNSSKQPLFTKEERMTFLRRSTTGLSNVEVDSYGGLLADYAKQHRATVIVKGLRAMVGFRIRIPDGPDQPQAEPRSGDGVSHHHRGTHVSLLQPCQTGGGAGRRYFRLCSRLHHAGHHEKNYGRDDGR